MIRQIRVPESASIPLRVRGEDGTVEERGVELSFGDFVRSTLLNHKRWQSSTKALRLSMELEDAFAEAIPGSSVDVSEEAWAGLCEALDPSTLRSPEIARALVRAGYWDAIESAPKKSGVESKKG